MKAVFALALSLLAAGCSLANPQQVAEIEAMSDLHEAENKVAFVQAKKSIAESRLRKVDDELSKARLELAEAQERFGELIENGK